MFGNRLRRTKLNKSFHRAIGPVLIAAHCFGLMPFAGVLNPNHNFIQFRWTNFRTLLAIVNIASGYLFTLISLKVIIGEGINLRNIVGVIFFGCCSSAIVLFIRLARNWREIMHKWYKSEESFVRKQLYPQEGLSMAVKMQVTSIIVFLLALVLVVAQIFGILPVAGILGTELGLLKFKWTNFRTLLTILNILSGFFFGTVLFFDVFKQGINAKNIVGVVFFSCCSTALILFLVLAQKWAMIMKRWYSLEKKFLKPPYTVYRWTVYRRIQVAAIFVLSIALVEHILYNASRWYEMHFFTTTCNVTIDDWWKYFFLNNFIFMFSILPYHVITTLYLEYSNFALTVTWNYMDLFIMLISIGISTRFKQVNRRLKLMSDKILPEKLWEQIRCDYVLLCELVEYIDGHLAPIILLSCTNNLYFICFQLLNIFNSLPHAINKVYFWFSLLYLIGRTIFVYLCAAEIHDASKVPLEIIRTIPTIGWCGELERFTEQVRSELIALSGSKFFYMTRKLLFGIAGTVVTYELVLLQFDQKEFNEDNANSTNSTFCGDKY